MVLMIGSALAVAAIVMVSVIVHARSRHKQVTQQRMKAILDDRNGNDEGILLL